jgi:pimeloyl-ACP methyl ester carboxylesterase
MFFDDADASIRDHTLERAATLPENVGREYLESTMVYDAARMDEAASRLRCPALLIQTTYFDQDLARRPLAPGQATPWTKLVGRHATGSDLHVLSGVGHFPMLEAPAAVRDILDGFIAALAT